MCHPAEPDRSSLYPTRREPPCRGALPALAARQAGASLAVFCAIYTFIFAFGIFYIYRLLRAGPAGYLIEPPSAAHPKRPMSLADRPRSTETTYARE